MATMFSASVSAQFVQTLEADYPVPRIAEITRLDGTRLRRTGPNEK
jgi:hypothetical protein